MSAIVIVVVGFVLGAIVSGAGMQAHARGVARRAIVRFLRAAAHAIEMGEAGPDPIRLHDARALNRLATMIADERDCDWMRARFPPPVPATRHDDGDDWP